MTKIIKNIDEYGFKTKITMADIARACNVSYITVWRWFHNKSLPSSKNLVKMALFLNISTDDCVQSLKIVDNIIAETKE